MEKYSLIGVSGNAYAIMGYVIRCMRNERCTKEEIDNYLSDATSSDYDHLLCVSSDMVEQLNEKAENYD